MRRVSGLILILGSFIVAYVTNQFFISLFLFIAGCGILQLGQVGRKTFEFTRLIYKYPNEAYDWFKEHSEYWKVYEGYLPDDYKNEIPSKGIKPLRIIVPKIGNQVIFIFGKFPECRDSEKKFLKHLKENELTPKTAVT